MKPHKIGWLNVPGYIPQTWNPIIGCSKVSEGCRNCYAEKWAARLAQILPDDNEYWCALSGEAPDQVNKWNGFTFLKEDALQKPLGWKKPRAIFVNSMGDLFHKNTDAEWIDQVFDIMEKCPQHLFIVLTKRATRMEGYFKSRWDLNGRHIPNVWLGVTAENQVAADERIPHLLNTPAAVRFVSCEPLLGNVVFPCEVLCKDSCCGNPKLDWIICGGESGPGARSMNPEWARSLRDQAQSASAPFFFKQWGSRPPVDAYESFPMQNAQMQAKNGGDFLGGRRWCQWPVSDKSDG